MIHIYLLDYIVLLILSHHLFSKTNSDSNSDSKTSDGTTVSVVRKKRGFFRKTKEKFWKALRPPRMNNCVGLMYKDLIIMSRTIGYRILKIKNDYNITKY